MQNPVKIPSLTIYGVSPSYLYFKLLILLQSMEREVGKDDMWQLKPVCDPYFKEDILNVLYKAIPSSRHN